MNGGEFYAEAEYIQRLLAETQTASDEEIDRILDKAERFEGLTHRDVAVLLNTESENCTQRIFRAARRIKEQIYGERVVLFAPLYISDYCVNNCVYCGFQYGNKTPRRRLSMEELREEVRLLEKMGHKRLALEAGEDPEHCPLSYVLDCIREIYAMKFQRGEIRRVNVNVAAMDTESYRLLKEAQIGTYILFQETYHRPTYELVHPSGPKHNYLWHTGAFDRAMEAGIADVGGGVLFGLYDPRFEVIGLMLHNEHLERKFGVGFHTISMPRLCPAEGAEPSPYAVDDELFLRLAAVVRLAVPYTGMIISTRESAEMRKKLIGTGISQISAGSSVEVGGYSSRANGGQQFELADRREASEIITWLMEEGLIPSFCTACYRKGRVGDRFMALAKSGNIKNVCLPNALFTLKEYGLDYGDERFNTLMNQIIEEKIARIDHEKVKNLVKERLHLLEEGQRDLFI
ncbi:MAG: [FeFe] hydrogenase H-cluster radical SAM maturase HydG [Clostridiales bacterium]|jgi:2-iminoacetate synthase|nr:[FeFe] hydrogenase H-cluster radical SAM maturase HydG [Clostridiales bacterium]